MPTMLAERPRPPGASFHTLYLMLYPDAAAAERIAYHQSDIRHRKGLRGEPMARSRLHITLYGLGGYRERPEGLIAQICAAMTRVRTSSFVVGLNTIQSWKGAPRPLVMLGDEGECGVRNLQSEIHRALVLSGLARGAAPNFRPHLTLLRDPCDAGEETIRPVEWRVREFLFVDSLYGEGRHERLGCWKLD